jgi:predicted dehydrogenase
MMLSRSAPCRVLMVGSGQRARRLVREMTSLEAVSLVAVTSPRVLQKARDWAGVPLFESLRTAIESAQPDAAVVAAATGAHLMVAGELLKRGIPTLLEKPIASDLTEAEALAGVASALRVPLVPAHNLLFATALDEVLRRPARACRCRFQYPPGASDALRDWRRSEVFEVLHHGVSLLQRTAPDEWHVSSARFQGADRPRSVAVQFEARGWAGALELNYEASDESLQVTVVPAASEESEAQHWSRRGRLIQRRQGVRTWAPEPRGGEIERMLLHFREVALGGVAPLVTPEDAVAVFRMTTQVLDALKHEGAPFI